MGAACGAGLVEGEAEQEAGPSLDQAFRRYRALRELAQRLDQQKVPTHFIFPASGELKEDARPPIDASGGHGKPGTATRQRRASGEPPALPQTPDAGAATETEPWTTRGTPPTRQLLLRDWQPSALAHESDEDGLASAAEAESVQGHEFHYEHRGPRNQEAWASSAPPFDNLELTKGEFAQRRNCAQANPSRACQSICAHQ